MIEKRPRFPFVAALLCAACVGAAAWTWMRYSYVWDKTITELYDVLPMSRTRWPWGSFVRVRGRTVNEVDRVDDVLFDILTGDYLASGTRPLSLGESDDDYPRMFVLAPKRWVRTRGEQEVVFTGRLVGLSWDLLGEGHHMTVDTSAGRFTGASVAGLVVGAMGVFVFTVALRHWLKERRAAEPDAQSGGINRRPSAGNGSATA